MIHENTILINGKIFHTWTEFSLVPKIHGQKRNLGQWATISHTWPFCLQNKKTIIFKMASTCGYKPIKNNIVYFINTIFIIIKRNYLSLQLGSTFTVCNTLISILKFALSTLNLKYFHKFLCPFYPPLHPATPTIVFGFRINILNFPIHCSVLLILI